WRRIFCDVFDMPVLKTNVDQNAASLGAAALAANSIGLWEGYDVIPGIHKAEERLEPDPTHAERYARLLCVYSQWTEALASLAEQMAVDTP
ncbi:hypothetical protein, partial [Desulfovibrio piger]|uniref:hypothetical protein n=1 Tax=Desulfovibrio piger TaxID=901 RepID=UPI0026ECBA7F